MKFGVTAFSRDGAVLLKRLCGELSRQGEICEGFISEKYLDPDNDPVTVKELAVSAGEWAKLEFEKADCLVFIGAAGIAVRSIAPWLKDKYTDPAVIVVDDAAEYAISLLSGHAGRANELTRRISRILGARPVITTSSDVHGICAVDEWAAALDLFLTDHKLAKEMASYILDGGTLGFKEDPVCAGYCAYKAKLCGVPDKPDNCDKTYESGLTVCVTPHRKVPYKGKVLRLVPGCAALGVGCKKGVEASVITEVINHLLERENLDEKSLFCIASVDLKNREQGLISAAAHFSVPFLTFPSSFLDALPGMFSESEFVRKVTGTGNVCERAAYAAAMRKEDHLNVKLLCGKYVENQVTAALAVPVYC